MENKKNQYDGSKKAAIKKALADPASASLNNTDLARLCNCSPKLVRDVKKELAIMPERATLALDEITPDPRLQMRVAMNEIAIRDYADAMADTDELAKFDPLKVVDDGGHNWLVDGYHRLAAARKAGIAELACEIYHGDFQLALSLAYSANAEHTALPRTNADKRKAVTSALADPRNADKGDAELASICHVTRMTVYRIRKTDAANGSEICNIVTNPDSSKTCETSNSKASDVNANHSRNPEAPTDYTGKAATRGEDLDTIKRAAADEATSTLRQTLEQMGRDLIEKGDAEAEANARANAATERADELQLELAKYKQACADAKKQIADLQAKPALAVVSDEQPAASDEPAQPQARSSALDVSNTSAAALSDEQPAITDAPRPAVSAEPQIADVTAAPITSTIGKPISELTQTQHEPASATRMSNVITPDTPVSASEQDELHDTGQAAMLELRLSELIAENRQLKAELAAKDARIRELEARLKINADQHGLD